MEVERQTPLPIKLPKKAQSILLKKSVVCSPKYILSLKANELRDSVKNGSLVIDFVSVPELRRNYFLPSNA
jgi:hypothetical protein